MILHDAVYNIMPYFKDDFIMFYGKNKRNYRMHFWTIGNLEDYKEIINNNEILKKCLKITNSTIKKEYEFPLKNGEVDLEKIDYLNFEKYEVISKEKKEIIDFEFCGNGEYSIDFGFFVINKILGYSKNKNIDLSDIIYNENNFSEIENYLNSILEKSNFYLTISLETEYGMDYVIYIPMKIKEIPAEYSDRISYGNFNHEEMYSKIEYIDNDINYSKHNILKDINNMVMDRFLTLELTSRYDDEGMVRNIDEIDTLIDIISNFEINK